MYIRQQILPRKGRAILKNKNLESIMNNNVYQTHKKNFMSKPTSPIIWQYQSKDPNKKNGKIDFLNVQDIQGAQASTFVHQKVRNKMKAQEYITKSRIYEKQNNFKLKMIENENIHGNNNWTNYSQQRNICYQHTFSLPKSRIIKGFTQNIHEKNLHLYKNLQISLNPIKMCKNQSSLSNSSLDYTLNLQSLNYELKKQKAIEEKQRQKRINKLLQPYKMQQMISQEMQFNPLTQRTYQNRQTSQEKLRKYNPTYLSSFAY